MKHPKDMNIATAQKFLDNKDPSGMYNYMKDYGYIYPELANGVVNGDSLAGNAALRHMQEIAEKNGIKLTAADINQIRLDMADGYLTTVAKKLDTGKYNEVEWFEAQAFHDRVFEKHGLPSSAWTMTEVLNSQYTNEGKEQAWNQSLNAAGNKHLEVALSVKATAEVFITMAIAGTAQNALAMAPAGPHDEQLRLTNEQLTRDINNKAEWLSVNVADSENLADLGSYAIKELTLPGVLFNLVDNFIQKMFDVRDEIRDLIDEISDSIKKKVEKFFDDFSEKVSNFFGEVKDIADEINDKFNDAKNFFERRDPLTLDLDGDGIETIAPNAGIVFDFDGDGKRTGTGWVKGDDGFVVLDLDGNGTIDNGSELFGVDTVKKDGTFAKDGFDALRELDSNNDGAFDASDDKYSQVKIWQDLNQDGISQVNELKSLSDLGITSINLTAKKTSIDSNGNLISAVGSYTKEDGTVGEANANQSLAANLDLAENPFYREFTDKIELSESVSILPDMNGSGAVRDLQEAAMLNPQLQQVLSAYANATTRDEQLNLLDQLISQWANSAQNYADFAQRINALDTTGIDIQYVSGGNTALLEHIRVLEIFNGSNFLKFSIEQTDKGLVLVTKSGVTENRKLLNVDENKVDISGDYIPVNAGQASLLNQAYESLRQSIYDGLLLKTRLSPYLDEIGFVFDAKGVSFNFDKTDVLFQSIFETDDRKAVQDLLDIYRIKGTDLNSNGWDGLTQLREWLANSDHSPELYNVAKQMGYILRLGADAGANIDGTTGADLLLGSAGDDVLKGGKGNDTLHGGAGNDTYVFELGGGHDTIIETHGDTDIDVLQFGQGISIGDLTITIKDNHLVISHINGYDSITILNWFNSSNDTAHRLDTLTFADGISFDLSNLQIGTNEADSLIGIENGNAIQDILVGGTGNDILVGNDGNDWLDGGAGVDTMYGGTGDDVYVIDNIGDVVVEEADAGIDTVEARISVVLADNVENLTLVGNDNLSATGNELGNVITGNSGNNALYGLDGNDTLIGNAGNDLLEGGSGTDTMHGGAGNDTYMVDQIGDVVVELSNQGIDTVVSRIDYTLGDNVENLTLVNEAVNGIGNTLNNTVIGNTLDNTLHGLEGNDTLDGGAGADILVGGVGHDTYVVDNDGDRVIENNGEGTDTVRSSIDYTLVDHVENLILTGTQALTGRGNELDNVIIGNSANNILYGLDGNDTLDGGLGADHLVGGIGDDVYIIDNTNDVVIENKDEGIDLVRSSIDYILTDHVENLTLTGGAAINATGNALENVITGNSGANVLDGGAGADILVGGAGNDTYVIDTQDTIIENAHEGIDTVVAAFDYTLGNNLENLTLTSDALHGTGNALDNVLTGNDQNNVLVGLEGNDTYIVQNVYDQTIEEENGGIDTVISRLDWTLATNVENLILTGTQELVGTGNELNNAITGNSAANTLYGMDGNDTLDGGLGRDTLVGGTGDDTYIVDNSDDVVVELKGEGIDLVRASANYILSDNVENLTLIGHAAINGTGNELDNLVVFQKVC